MKRNGSKRGRKTGKDANFSPLFFSRVFTRVEMGLAVQRRARAGYSRLGFLLLRREMCALVWAASTPNSA